MDGIPNVSLAHRGRLLCVCVFIVKGRRRTSNVNKSQQDNPNGHPDAC